LRLLHIAEADAWAAGAAAGLYAPESLASEGFVHCSTPEQVVATGRRYYAGRTGLLLLSIDSSRAAVPLKWEPGPTGELFPHLYGSIPTAAVVSVEPFDPGA
jgi:uncharacterized protein (DUF952 family)